MQLSQLEKAVLTSETDSVMVPALRSSNGRNEAASRFNAPSRMLLSMATSTEGIFTDLYGSSPPKEPSLLGLARPLSLPRADA